MFENKNIVINILLITPFFRHMRFSKNQHLFYFFLFFYTAFLTEFIINSICSMNLNAINFLFCLACKICFPTFYSFFSYFYFAIFEIYEYRPLERLVTILGGSAVLYERNIKTKLGSLLNHGKSKICI